MNAALSELRELRGAWTPQDYSERLVVPEGRVAIASDVHIPYHDERLLARFLDLATATSADSIVWLGDLMDMPTHSSWGQDDWTTTFEREMEMTAGILRLAATRVPVQYWSSGNHEERFIRRCGKQVGMLALARMLGLSDLLTSGRLIVSDHPTLLHEPYTGATEEGDGWLFTHPAQYGAQPLLVPGAIADLEHRNVIAGHAHHWGMGSSPSGDYTVIESGGLFEPKHIKYVQHRVTKHRKWCKGFVLLDHGEPHLVRGEPLPIIHTAQSVAA